MDGWSLVRAEQEIADGTGGWPGTPAKILVCGDCCRRITGDLAFRRDRTGKEPRLLVTCGACADKGERV